MNYEKLGKNISVARKKRGLTQENLAEKIEVSTVFISQIENAARKPSLDTMCKLSQILETSIDALIDTPSLHNTPHELLALLCGKSTAELTLITNVVRTLCSGIKNDHICSL